MSTSPTASPSQMRWQGSYHLLQQPHQNETPQHLTTVLEKIQLKLTRSDLTQKKIELLQHQKHQIEKLLQAFKYPLPEPSTIALAKRFSETAALNKLLHENASEEVLKNAIKTTSTELREYLYWLIWLHEGMPPTQNYGRDRLLAEPKLLQRITTPLVYSKGKNLIEQLMHYFKDAVAAEECINPCLKNELHLRQKSAFERLVSENVLSHKQLKRSFYRLPEEIRTQVQQPPYYGHGIDHCLYKRFGAHVEKGGTRFQVMALKADEIHVVLIDPKEEKKFLMQKDLETGGIWQCFIPQIGAGAVYVYELKQGEKIVRKTDPFGFGYRQCHDPFRHESIVVDTSGLFESNPIPPKDGPRPTIIYEVHLPSWKTTSEGQPLNYREIAKPLVDFCLSEGYTDVEFMGFMGHPQLTSWGYQPTDFFSSYHLQGSLHDLKYLIDALRNAGLGVIADWPVAHFAVDQFSLRNFDAGNALFEHPDPRRSEHPIWGTINFNLENPFTRDFLISNAHFLIYLGFTSLRLDALESMYFLDFHRKGNDWLPNHKGTAIHGAAIQFTKDLVVTIKSKFPQAEIIAEEASYFRSMTKPFSENGLGFDAMWAMKSIYWTLQFMEKPYTERRQHFDWVIHAVDIWEKGNARINLISHDNVDYRTLPEYMPGDIWQKWANVRLFWSFQFCIPGQKLIFMASSNPEVAWGKKIKARQEAVEWHSQDSSRYPLTAEFSRGLSCMQHDLNHLYRSRSELWELDNNPDGIKWISANDRDNLVMSYHRRDHKGKQLACVHNFNVDAIENYIVRFPDLNYAPEIERLESMKEIFNTDDKKYQGSGVVNTNVEILKDEQGRPCAFKIRMAPLATMIFEECFV